MQRTGGFEDIAEIRIADRTRAFVYEHGWQSWSPTGRYRIDLPRSPRPVREIWQSMSFRPELPGPTIGFQSEGLLVVEPGDGTARSWLAPRPDVSVASVRARLDGDHLIVSANGPLEERPTATRLDASLASIGDALAVAMPARPIRAFGPGWCSWYGYWHEITDHVLDENLRAIDDLGLEVRVVQIDDGYQADIGDWLDGSGRIASMAAAADRIRATGREAGVWTAPFFVGANSRLAREHPDWLVHGVIAAHHWGQAIRVLDVTHPDAAAHLVDVFATLCRWGFTFHKIDFLFGGAMVGGRHGDADPIAAYREGLRLIREGLGDDATILGCGAPLLSSIGLVDAMRVSPDVGHELDHESGDISQPSMRGALAAGRPRAWMHGRLWVNDPDCLLATPRMADREGWADHIRAYGGLAMSGDRLTELDARGIELTRELLRPSGTVAPAWEPDAGPDGGRLAAGVAA